MNYLPCQLESFFCPLKEKRGKEIKRIGGQNRAFFPQFFRPTGPGHSLLPPLTFHTAAHQDVIAEIFASVCVLSVLFSPS